MLPAIGWTMVVWGGNKPHCGLGLGASRWGWTDACAVTTVMDPDLDDLTI